MDVIYLLVAAVLVAVTSVFLVLCERLARR